MPQFIKMGFHSGLTALGLPEFRASRSLIGSAGLRSVLNLSSSTYLRLRPLSMQRDRRSGVQRVGSGICRHLVEFANVI